jgi:hypothetical protein
MSAVKGFGKGDNVVLALGGSRVVAMGWVGDGMDLYY